MCSCTVILPRPLKRYPPSDCLRFIWVGGAEIIFLKINAVLFYDENYILNIKTGQAGGSTVHPSFSVIPPTAAAPSRASSILAPFHLLPPPHLVRMDGPTATSRPSSVAVCHLCRLQQGRRLISSQSNACMAKGGNHPLFLTMVWPQTSILLVNSD